MSGPDRTVGSSINFRLLSKLFSSSLAPKIHTPPYTKYNVYHRCELDLSNSNRESHREPVRLPRVHTLRTGTWLGQLPTKQPTENLIKYRLTAHFKVSPPLMRPPHLSWKPREFAFDRSLPMKTLAQRSRTNFQPQPEYCPPQYAAPKRENVLHYCYI